MFFLVNGAINLDYSRVEVAAAARRDGCSCGTSLQVHHNKVDAVRSARPCGVNLAEFSLVTFKENGKKIGLSKNIVICRL